MSGLIQEYVAIVRTQLGPISPLMGRTLDELVDHLHDSTAALVASGLRPELAEQQAIAAFGDPILFVHQLTHQTRMIRLLLLIASAGSAAIGIWLLGVVTLLLPGNQPLSEILFWIVVMLCFFAYAIITWVYLHHPQKRWLSFLITIGAVMGMIGGVAGIVQNIWSAVQREDSEGYIVLMGLALIGHGTLVLLYRWRWRRLLNGRPV